VKHCIQGQTMYSRLDGQCALHLFSECALRVCGFDRAARTSPSLGGQM